jgi:hypothetical protein
MSETLALFFQCAITRKCIYETWRCDSDRDCGPEDDSDEANCTETTPVPKAPDTSFVRE